MSYKCPNCGIIPASYVRNWGKLYCLQCYKGGDINNHRNAVPPENRKIIEVVIVD